MSYTDVMATNEKPPYRYEEPIASRPGYKVPNRIDDDQCMGRSPRPYVAVAATFMFVALAIMFGVIFLTTRSNDLVTNTAHLEVKQMGDIRAALDQAFADERFLKLAESEPDVRGERMWARLIQERLIDEGNIGKLVSLNSPTDVKPYREDVMGGRPTSEPWCSYTAPSLGKLRKLYGHGGDDRAVLITFNARNWNNYPDEGIVVFWTDADVAEFLPFEYFEENYGITEEEWADPAGKLFGKKAPFQYTYE